MCVCSRCSTQRRHIRISDGKMYDLFILLEKGRLSFHINSSQILLSRDSVKVKTLVSDWGVSRHVPIDLCACVCMCVPSFAISI